MVQDEETKIARPRQIYTGERERSYVPIDQRKKAVDTPVDARASIDPARA
jgi:citrate synthase